MEPITLAVVALTVVATKATEKVGEKLGEGVITSAQKWLERLQLHAPETAKRLAAASDPNVIDVEILEEVKQAAAAYPDVQASMTETVTAAAADSGTFPNLTKLADKIATVNFGTITTQNINF